ncbi:MAG: hypothetical protein KDD70_00920 [Bdellovibrionales bacterium]|nr:hypothetical protein [Bdellovibrionales bacterium]
MKERGHLLEQFDSNWIGNKVSVQELDANDPSLSPLLEAFKLGLEVRHFRTSSSSWNEGRGRAGFVIFEEGVPVKVFVTAMN